MSTSDSPPRPSPIVPGYQLDRYEMLCPIAEGGMASVWVARLRGKRGFEKLVAIKTILPKYAQDPRFERMFLDEAGLAARIEHANVAQVLDLGEKHDVLYLAMEFVDGDSLSKILRVAEKNGVPFPPGIALRVLADTCGGLHAAHEVRGRDGDLLNVVHRDVSPQNILVTTQGVTKLIDFGIAKARDRVSDDTSAGVLKGKIQFMAPEQAFGKPVDRRADIWAVGAILYFLLSGRTPFAAESEIASLSLLSAGRPPLPLPPHVHPAISAIVRGTLARNPADRFATAAELQAALEAAMLTAGLVTTTAGVAAFVQQHMADRAKRRREALDMALSAASQREKVAHMLERAGADSLSAPGVAALSSGPAPVIDGTYATVLLGGAPSRGETLSTRSSPQSESSSGTLESTTAAPVSGAGLPRKLGGPVAVFVSVFVVMLLIGGAVIVIARPSRRAPVAVAAPPPAVATVSVPSFVIPPVASVPSAISSASSASAASTAWNVIPQAGSATAASAHPATGATPVVRTVPRQTSFGGKPSTNPSTATSKERVNDGF